ncbi:hypothetical protein Tco_0730884 [Tanacetum coccineum]
MVASVRKPEAQWSDGDRKAVNLDQHLKSLIKLPKKWLSFCQSLKNVNHVRDYDLTLLFGKLKYEENLIDSIYDTKKKKSLTTTTPLSATFFSSSIVQDFQDSPDDEEDTRSIQEYMDDLEMEFHERALLDKSKWFFKKGTQRFSGAKATEKTKCYKCGRTKEVSSDDNEMVKVKVLMALADDESGVVGKESTISGEWVKISIRKV